MLTNTRALIATNEMTLERALSLINASHARTELAPEDVFIFRMNLSNQAVDSYHTRMGDSTLRNYAADFTQGRALLNSHRAGGFNGAELPIGRSFHAEVSGMPLAQKAAYEAVNGASLAVYSYVQRGLKLTDVATNDIIRGIEGGTINDVSVGFGMDGNGLARCSVCGSNLMDWESCTHIPGNTYESGRAYAWIEGARGREASLVYMASTPNAMIDKVVRMVDTGHLGRADALRFGEEWGVRIFGEKTFAKAEVKTERQEPVTWDKFLEGLRVVDTTQADRIAGLNEDQRFDALLTVIRDQRSAMTSLETRAGLGDKWLADLVDQAVKARVRAEASDFDGERYRGMLTRGADPDFIRSEIASWTRAATAALGDGKRPTGGATKTSESQKLPSRVYMG